MFTKKKMKLKIGDVAEIETPRGLAYVQYTHDAKDQGELVRVLPGLFPSRPDLAALVKERELYSAFYTLEYAVRAKQAEIVCNLPVPKWSRPEPLMRHEVDRTRSGVVTGWRIVPALQPLTVDFLIRTPVLRTLTPEQTKLSIRSIWPHPAMVKALAQEWTPERSEELEEQAREMARARKANQHSPEAGTSAMRHYLYFPRKRDAESAGKQLRDRDYSVEVRRSADGESWLALARKDKPESAEEMDTLRDEMETLAAEHGGEYDGWDMMVDSPGAASATEIN